MDSQLPTVFEDDSSMVESESLLSVCPSEPGGGIKTSSYQSSEEGGSVEDLLDPDQRKRHRGGHLLPTSSLPNLHPFRTDSISLRPLTTASYQFDYPSPSWAATVSLFFTILSLFVKFETYV